MKSNISIRESVPDDIHSLSSSLREPDRLEVLASGSTPFEALTESYKASTIRLSAFLNGKIIAMFGIAPKTILGETAVVWLLTAPEVEQIKFTFVKLSKRHVKLFLEQYPILENWVDSRYTQAIKWLELLGAKFDLEQNVNGIPFYHFEIRRR
jgi:hypothetical protein